VLREDPTYIRLQESSALRPETTTRTTARDMARLLTAVWTDTAGPPDACAQLRNVMGLQASSRLSAGLPNARVSAKSGSLLGVVRNEVGVAEFPDGQRFAVAIFTRLPGTDFAAGPLVDGAIGEVARLLVEALRRMESQRPADHERRS
jgi:beta-lactamase class A